MNTKRILIILATVAGFALIGLGIYQFSTVSSKPESAANQPKEVAANFVVAMTTAEIAQAYEYGSAFYKAKNTPESVEKFSDTIRSENAKISTEEVYKGLNDASDKAIYLALVDNLPPSSTGSTSANFIVRLVKEDGGWKVDSLEVR